MVLVPTPPLSPPLQDSPGCLARFNLPVSFLFFPLPPLLCVCQSAIPSSVWSPIVRLVESSSGLLQRIVNQCPLLASRAPSVGFLNDMCGWWYLSWLWVEGRRRRRSPR